MNFQNPLATICAIPLALCLLAQPVWADARALPEIDVQQPARNSLEDGFSKASCGIITVGNSGPSKKFTIRNVGNAPLTGLTITLDGTNVSEFKVTLPRKSTLAPGASTTFTVTFKPKRKDVRSAVIHIRSNDADESPFDVTLTGKGLPRK